MKTVNPWFLRQLIFPLIAEDESISPLSNKFDICREIRNYVLPEVQSRKIRYQIKLKNTLAYYLQRDTSFDDYFTDPVFLSIVPPTPARLYFEWVWSELYPNDSYNDMDFSDYKVVPLIEEPLMLCI